MLSKQWINTTNVGNCPSAYNEPLLTYLLSEIQSRGHIAKSSFTQEMDKSIASKYAPISLSTLDSLRYVRSLLLASELVVLDGANYIINPLATAIVDDLIANAKRISPPSEETEYESYWNTMSHGVFDIITQENISIYAAFFPNLLR